MAYTLEEEEDDDDDQEKNYICIYLRSNDSPAAIYKIRASK
jgi:hypothetical protein